MVTFGPKFSTCYILNYVFFTEDRVVCKISQLFLLCDSTCNYILYLSGIPNMKNLFYCVWFKDTVKYKSVRNFHCNQKWNFPDDNVKVSELMTTPKKNPLWTPAWNLFSLLLTIRNLGFFFDIIDSYVYFFFFFRKSTKCDGNFGQIINDNCQFLNEK